MRDFTLRTKLLVMMLLLLLLSLSILFLLHLYAEQRLLAQVRDYTDELSTAIEIAQEQPGAEGEPQVILQAYAEKLRKLGVKDVTFADAAEEVQASTDPKAVGKPLVRSKRRGPKEYVVRGILGDESGPPGSQKTSRLTVPIVVRDQRIGYLQITRILDDFSELSSQAFAERLIATLAVFALGILISLYLAFSLSRPLQRLTRAAEQVAAGDLSVRVPPDGGDEVASLTRTFNSMVERLREKQKLEEQLHFAERSTAIGRLASAVAHEVRNPLNFLSLSIDHVRSKLFPEDEARRRDFERILTNMKAEISRLNRLVVDFLSFGKPMRLDRRACALGELVREVAALVDHKARDQGIGLAVEVATDVPEIVADAELLKTCLLNLMINAVDAMPSGGILITSVRSTRLGDAAAVEIEVRDNGQGMTPEAVRSAFEPYFSTKETGVGLGLALTHKIVLDHGGTLTLESELGRGTTARLVLPLQVPAAITADAELVHS
jgi:signal transduction histidine kinase